MDTTRSPSSDWISRIVDIDCNTSLQDVRDLFSQCGEIRGIYPWKSDKSPQQHYFLEFAHKSSVANARALGKLHHHLSVHALSMVPQLIERCRAVAPRSIEDPLAANTMYASFSSRPASPGSSRESSAGPARKRTRRGGVKNRIRMANKGPYAERSSAGSSRGRDSSPHPFSSNAFKSEVAPSSPAEHRRPEDDKENDAHRTQFQLSLPHPLIPVPIPIQLHDPPNIPVPSHVPNARIYMTISGERISLDLSTLGDDPQPVIALLKVAECGRDSWMVVGGHYRLRGIPAAALAVISAMVQVLTAAGVPEYELKPAYLMLSGCQRDLAKRAEAGSEEARFHFAEAMRWLQKVYGRDAPPLDPHPPASSVVGVISDPGRARRPSREDQTNPHNAHGATGRRAEPTNTGHIRILEREVQCLRSRLDSSGAQVRRLEAELAGERERRRGREREVEEVRGRLEAARRVEEEAVERVRREVEARRRAEEREGRGLLEVAEALRRAARGERVAVEGLFGGGTRGVSP